MTENPYKIRAVSLETLGHATYQDYLRSQAWADIRKSKLAESPLCPCGNKANQVHHSCYTYLVMAGHDLSGLVSCCGRCHRRAERRARLVGAAERPVAATLDILSPRTRMCRGGRRQKVLLGDPMGCTWKSQKKIKPVAGPRKREIKNKLKYEQATMRIVAAKTQNPPTVRLVSAGRVVKHIALKEASA